MKKRVFAFVDHYLPGHRAGGPIQSVANLVDQLSDRLEFFIFTRDRDKQDTAPFPNVRQNGWNQHGKSQVYYASPSSLSPREILKVVNETSHDIVYLNSFFSALTIKFLVLRKLRLMPERPIIIAPRGELSPGALKIKARKKDLYIKVVARLGLYSQMTWQASSTMEESEIRQAFGQARDIVVAPNLAVRLSQSSSQRQGTIVKERGQGQFVYLSRITPKKNLIFAIKLLAELTGKIGLDIYGPISDTDYWDQCKRQIARLPPNVCVTYQGAIDHDDVIQAIRKYHFFLLPTHSENFGHAIMEAMSAGCPVIISDQTPWRNLSSSRAGWDIPLYDEKRWRDVLQACVAMPSQEYAALSCSAWRFFRGFVSNERHIASNVDLFLSRPRNAKEIAR